PSVLLSALRVLSSMFLRPPPPPSSTLFPYTTLFRSLAAASCDRFRRWASHDPRSVEVGVSQTTRRFESVSGRARFLAFHLDRVRDRKSTRLNSSHVKISYAVFCLKKKKNRWWHTWHP